MKTDEERRRADVERVRRYRAKYPERAKEQYKRYRETHKEEIRERQKAWCKAHALELSEKRHAYYMAHREKYLENSRRQRERAKAEKGG